MDEQKKQHTQSDPQVETYRLSDGTIREIKIEAPPPDPEEIRKEKKDRRKLIRGVIISGSILVVLIVAFILVWTYVAEPFRVDGASMYPTLEQNEFVWLAKYAYWNDTPAQDDIVLCWYPQERESFVKRVIGLPGDTVELRSGALYLNGELVEEPYVVEKKIENMALLTVPDGHYFVVGDNRQVSRDSRNPEVGCIPLEHILGRAEAVVYPFDKFHSLKMEE